MLLTENAGGQKGRYRMYSPTFVPSVALFMSYRFVAVLRSIGNLKWDRVLFLEACMITLPNGQKVSWPEWVKIITAHLPVTQ